MIDPNVRNDIVFDEGYERGVADERKRHELREWVDMYKKIPDKDGWYWFNGKYFDTSTDEWNPMEPPEVRGSWREWCGMLYVSDGYCEYIAGDGFDADEIWGEFRGPIPNPFEEEVNHEYRKGNQAIPQTATDDIG